MTKCGIVWAAFLINAFTLVAGEDVKITGTFQVEVACYDTYHEEIPMVVVPGKDKFSGTPHALSLTSELKKGLRIGDKITVSGKKQPARRLKMTKGQIRMAMVDFIQKGRGFPLQCRDMSEIMAGIRTVKVTEGDGAAVGSHDHGVLKLEPAADDHKEVEVQVSEHIQVSSIDVIKSIQKKGL